MTLRHLMLPLLLASRTKNASMQDLLLSLNMQIIRTIKLPPSPPSHYHIPPQVLQRSLRVHLPLSFSLTFFSLLTLLLTILPSTLSFTSPAASSTSSSNPPPDFTILSLSIKEFLRACRDVTRALRSLYLDGNILYRGISEKITPKPRPGVTSFPTPDFEWPQRHPVAPANNASSR
jgi:hypothetical protein